MYNRTHRQHSRYSLHSFCKELLPVTKHCKYLQRMSCKLSLLRRFHTCLLSMRDKYSYPRLQKKTPRSMEYTLNHVNLRFPQGKRRKRMQKSNPPRYLYQLHMLNTNFGLLKAGNSLRCICYKNSDLLTTSLRNRDGTYIHSN